MLFLLQGLLPCHSGSHTRCFRLRARDSQCMLNIRVALARSRGAGMVDR
jgi:hypothetical protein